MKGKFDKLKELDLGNPKNEKDVMDNAFEILKDSPRMNRMFCEALDWMSW